MHLRLTYGCRERHTSIARVPQWVVGEDVARSIVRRLLRDDYPTPLPINIVHPPTRMLSSRARCFIDYLLGLLG